MNAIMNEKGRQTKLLAAIAILAMVVCAFAVAMPAGESDAAPVDVVAAPDNAVEVTTPEALATAISNGTSNIEITAAISVETETYSLAENQSIWITGSGKLTMAGGTMTVNGTIYNNVGTNDSNSGLVLTSGTVTFGSTGVLYSVCAVDAQASVDVTAYFTSTDTAVSGYSQYQHYYSGNIATLVPIATENSNYTGVPAGNWIVSYGDKSITGNVNLGDTGLYVMTGDITIADSAVLAADAVNAGTYTSIVNNGIIIAHSYTVTSLTNTYLAVTIPEGTEATYSNGTFTISGTALAADTTNAKPEGDSWSNVFGSAAGYAYIQVDGLQNLYGEIADPEYRIVQTNAALQMYQTPVDEYVDLVDGVWTKDKTYSAVDNIDQYAFLVPKTGNVGISVYDGDSTPAVATLTFNLSNTGTSSIVTTVDETALETAFAQNDDVTYTGTQPTSSIDLSMMTSEQTFTMTNVSGYASSSPLDITVGDTTITVSNLSADVIVFSVGSVVLYAENLSGDFDNVNDLELSGDLGDDVTLDVDDTTPGNGLAYVNAGTTLDLNGHTLTIMPGVVLTARGTITNGTIEVRQGATLDYSNLENVTLQNMGGTIKIDGAQGTENIISVTQSVNGTYYLSGNTTILEGVTFTVPRGATLDLMGYNLTVQGTLVVESRGTITSGATVNNDYGTIVLTRTGSIQNSGTIGDTMEITVANGANDENGNYTQTVDMQGVTGVSFKLDRDSSRTYVMSVSGDITTVTGATVSKLTLNSVGIDADMTISRNVDFTANTVTVDNGVVFTHNGKSAEFNGFTILNGASVVINGDATGDVIVATGQVTDGKDPSAGTTGYTTKVTLGASGDDGYVTGISISADRVNIPNEVTGKTDVYQRMYVSGTLDVTPDVSTDRSYVGTIGITGVAYIADSLVIPEEANITFGSASYFDVSASGTITVEDRAGTLNLNYNGARYIVETTNNNVPVETTYYTSFASAMDQIATAQHGIVYIAGEYEISGEYTVGEDQEISYEASRYPVTVTDGIVVSETGQVNVNGGLVSNNAFKLIEGRVIVSEGIGYVPPEDQGVYAVVTVDEETLDTTYSGFKIALDNAAAGQTITVVDDATYNGNMVVPADVTVDVNSDKTLTVLGNVTIETSGKLILDDGATLKVGKDSKDYTVTVNGELDASEGGTIVNNSVSGTDDAFTSNVNIYSTGTLSYPAEITETQYLHINAALVNDAGEVMYTSVANAVAYAEENMLSSVTAVGKFTENGAIDADNVDIIINGQITLGDVTLNEASIYIATSGSPATKNPDAWYTAAVSGLSGTENGTATVSVYQTQATVASSVTLDATGASDYTLSIDGFDNNTEIVSGTVDYVGETIVTDRDNVLTIGNGATLLITGEVSVSGEYITNNGTIQIDDEAALTVMKIDNTPDISTDNDFTYTVIPGNVIVSEGATLSVPAEDQLTVTGDVTVETDGTFDLNGTLLVGEAPTLLGESTTGTVSEEVDVDVSAKVIVFNGSSIADAQLSNDAGTVKSTAFVINGITMATYYTFANTNIAGAVDDYVYGLEDLQTNKIENGQETDDPIDIIWYSGETQVTNERIGDYTEVTTEIQYRSVPVTISVGTHITLSIDNVIYNVNGTYGLTIGTHTVSVVVDPGYSGDVTITFNGQTIQNGGTITVTSDMINALEAPVLSATGQLTQDSTVVIDGGNQGGSDMGLTDYLLIILVILIVIMAIIVALRLMRS